MAEAPKLCYECAPLPEIRYLWNEGALYCRQIVHTNMLKAIGGT